MTATATVTITPTAAEQWKKVREALPVPVLLAPAYDPNKGKNRKVVHLLALQDLVRRGRVMTGLDVLPFHLPAESCFCASSGDLGDLVFHIARIRSEQQLYPIPTCSRCLRLCHSLTGLAVDLIKETRVKQGKDPAG
jgi:hypothetical protein